MTDQDDDIQTAHAPLRGLLDDLVRDLPPGDRPEVRGLLERNLAYAHERVAIQEQLRRRPLTAVEQRALMARCDALTVRMGLGEADDA